METGPTRATDLTRKGSRHALTEEGQEGKSHVAVHETDDTSLDTGNTDVSRTLFRLCPSRPSGQGLRPRRDIPGEHR